MEFIIICVVLTVIVSFCSDAATTTQFRRDARNHFQESSRQLDAHWAKEAKEQDVYYQRQSTPIIAPDRNFYSDGSLKFDPATGKSYQKGQYHARSDGYMANGQRAGNGVKKAPK